MSFVDNEKLDLKTKLGRVKESESFARNGMLAEKVRLMLNALKNLLHEETGAAVDEGYNVDEKFVPVALVLVPLCVRTEVSAELRNVLIAGEFTCVKVI